MLTTLVFVSTFASPDRGMPEILDQVHADDRNHVWYQVLYQDQHIGSYTEARSITKSGTLEVRRMLNFKLIPNRATRVETVLTFSSDFPYALQRARETTEVETNFELHLSEREYQPKPSVESTKTQMTYFDTLPFLPELLQDRTNLNVASVDFGRSQVKQANWQLTRRDEESSVSHWVQDKADASVRVLKNGVVADSSTPSNINLRLATRTESEAWQTNPTLLSNSEIAIPSDKPIRNHETLSLLKLQVTSTTGEFGDWQNLVSDDKFIYIDRSQPQRADLTEARLPGIRVQDPAIQKFIENANLPETASASTQVRHLVNYLHNEIEYQESSVQSTIEETVARKFGDCTEFSDLFDAIAMEIGWLTRKRHGLAYHPPTQTFRMHAWNEVVLDGYWVPIDATMNQVPADASHVPFPPTNMLALLRDAPNLQFEVLEQRHTEQLN